MTIEMDHDHYKYPWLFWWRSVMATDSSDGDIRTSIDNGQWTGDQIAAIPFSSGKQHHSLSIHSIPSMEPENGHGHL